MIFFQPSKVLKSHKFRSRGHPGAGIAAIYWKSAGHNSPPPLFENCKYQLDPVGEKIRI